MAGGGTPCTLRKLESIGAIRPIFPLFIGKLRPLPEPADGALLALLPRVLPPGMLSDAPSTFVLSEAPSTGECFSRLPLAVELFAVEPPNPRGLLSTNGTLLPCALGLALGLAQVTRPIVCEARASSRVLADAPA